MKKEKLLPKQEREKILTKILNHLDALPHSNLVRIGCAINHHIWPDELPHKPERWESMSWDEQGMWAGTVFKHIEARVGYKSMLRYYKTVNEGKTDQEFEDWWDSNHSK